MESLYQRADLTRRRRYIIIYIVDAPVPQKRRLFHTIRTRLRKETVVVFTALSGIVIIFVIFLRLTLLSAPAPDPDMVSEAGSGETLGADTYGPYAHMPTHTPRPEKANRVRESDESNDTSDDGHEPENPSPEAPDPDPTHEPEPTPGTEDIGPSPEPTGATDEKPGTGEESSDPPVIAAETAE